MFGMNSIFECKRLKIAKVFTLKWSKKILGTLRLPPRVTPILAMPLTLVDCFALLGMIGFS